MKNASIIFDHNLQSPESLAEAIDDMGFESPPTESSSSISLVLTDTQLIPCPGLTREAQQEAWARLSHVQGVLEVRQCQDQGGLSVTFVPSLTSALLLGEVVSSLAPLEIHTSTSGSPTERAPTLAVAPIPASAPASAPSPNRGGGVELVKMRIEGMVCLSGTTTMQGKIGKLKGVKKIKGEFSTFVCVCGGVLYMCVCAVYVACPLLIVYKCVSTCACFSRFPSPALVCMWTAECTVTSAFPLVYGEEVTRRSL